ncbi:sensor histidine kinase [Pedobacter boryungensis]|uniref:histidine kinase n=1 Tax=Pedobacter boryungensis TaxID=869962 RepID=A0ABX2DAK4_9SPHI|nr:HAMP domain-containing sensor histidine kinase [Pedobacter boryungensis]NQX30458.1 HAMP domain-containing histidine kinase [Pedobacter boryungensis]
MLYLGKELTSKRFIGDPKLFSLEERIFNTVCLFVLISMCFEIPFNLYMGLMVSAFLSIFGLFFCTVLYYLSRFKRKSKLGINLFCLLCNGAITGSYFYNSGINGPNLLMFVLVFFLSVSIIPKKNFKIWLPLNVLLVLSIIVVEYLYPELIPNIYTDKLTKTIDYSFTYLIVGCLIYLIVSYIRQNYDHERVSAMEKNIAIEQQHAEILLQKKELERLNSEKDKLFSIVSHDIRMPLNSIQGYLEMLSEHDLVEEEKEYLKQQLLQLTRDTSDMVLNILSWSKTQMEGSYVELAQLNVSKAINEGLNVERNAATIKGVELQIKADENLIILADKNMFQLVIRNLVNNAIKFTPAGGTITISTHKNEDNCCISIKDNGLGIDPKQQDTLFKLKASSTFGTNNERGIGLGLLLCKEFTDLQGGTIGFERNIDKGSNFFLSFKLAN